MNVDELRENVPSDLTEAQAFFYKNAGYSYGQGETAREGLIRTAKELAKAEAWAEEMAVQFIWEDDDQPAEVYNDETSKYDEMPAVVCIAKLHGEVIASLCGITESDNYQEAKDYRRVVEAELADEGRSYLPNLAESYKTKANLFLSDYERYNEF